MVTDCGSGAIAPDILIPSGANTVSTLAGSATTGALDGVGAAATFANPVNVALHTSGDLLVTDFENGALRRVQLDGTVTTVLPVGTLSRPFGIAVNSTGQVYVETDGNTQNVVNTLTGSVWSVDLSAGTATIIAENLGRPRGLAVLSSGQLVMSDLLHHTVRLLDPLTGVVTPLAGVTDVPGCADGVGVNAGFLNPYGVVVTATDEIFLAEYGSHRIRKVLLTGQVTTYSGQTDAGLVDGPLSTARFRQPKALAFDAQGVLYVSDAGNHRIRRISATGDVSTLAGDGTAGFADGNDLMSQFFGQEGIATSGNGLFVADGNGGNPLPYHRIRRISLP